MRLNELGKERVMGWADTIAYAFAWKHIDTLSKSSGKELVVEDIIEDIRGKVAWIVEQDLIHATHIKGGGIKVEYTHYNDQEPSIEILLVVDSPPIYLSVERHFEPEEEEGLFEETDE